MQNSYKTKKKLSVALCIRNEEEKLKKCLDALTFVDEIIIRIKKNMTTMSSGKQSYAHEKV